MAYLGEDGYAVDEMQTVPVGKLFAHLEREGVITVPNWETLEKALVSWADLSLDSDIYYPEDRR